MISACLKLMLFCFVGGLLLACGGSEKESVKATAVPTVSAEALQTIAAEMFPQTKGQFGIEFNPCGLQACPITERLRQRLASLTGRNANMICRCQNFSDTRTVTVEVTPTGGIAHVVLFRDSWKMDLIIVRSGDKLLVDDTACTGKPGTSIYTSADPC